MSALAVIGLASSAAAAPLDSSLFNHQYNGDVHPVPGFTENAGSPPWATPTTDGNILTYQGTILEGGYWQSDQWLGGPNPVANATGWTIEFRIRIRNDADDDPTGGAFNTFAKDGNGTSATGRRVQITVGKNWTKASSFSATLYSTLENTNDFHVFRVAQPANSRSITLWRDGVQLYSGDSRPSNDSSSLLAQMYFGDGSSGTGGPTVELDYFRWDSTGFYDPVVVLPTVVQHPQNATNIVGANVTLTATFTNAVTSVQWYKDNAPIGGATSFSQVNTGQFSAYNIPSLQPLNEGTYFCTANNSSGSVTTAPVYLDVLTDVTPPTVISNVVSSWAKRVRVRFSEPTDSVTTGQPTNYVFQGGALTVASVSVLDASRVDVFTTTHPLPGSSYVLEISNVKDTSDNMIAANTPVAFTVSTNFPAMTNLIMAFNENSAVASVHGGVDWQDLSGAENHAGNPNALPNKRPTLLANTLQGHGVFRFAPTSSDVVALRVPFTGSVGLNQSNYTWFAVARCSNLGNGSSTSLTPSSTIVTRFVPNALDPLWISEMSCAFYNGGSETSFQKAIYSSGRDGAGNQLAAFSHPIANNQWSLISGRIDPTRVVSDVLNPGANIHLIQTNATAPPGVGAFPPDSVWFGSYGDNRFRFGGDMAEVLIYTGTLSQGERDEIENYLRTKYFTPDAPVAVTDAISRAAALATKVSIASLLANDTDADEGDILSFVNASGSSTNGATVTSDASYVYYLPANNVSDSFTYTIKDAHSLYATGTVLVTVAPAPSGGTLNITGVSTNGDGNYILSLAGIPGETYIVEATTNIVTPTWVPIGANVAGPNGLWTFIDLDSTNYPSRFYRTTVP